MVRYMRETKAVSAEAPDEETLKQCSRGGRRGREGAETFNYPLH